MKVVRLRYIAPISWVMILSHYLTVMMGQRHGLSAKEIWSLMNWDRTVLPKTARIPNNLVNAKWKSPNQHLPAIPQIAVFVGPVVACLFSVFGFCLALSDTPYAFRWLHHISYFRAGFHVAVHSVYGFNRTKIHCSKSKISLTPLALWHLQCMFSGIINHS